LLISTFTQDEILVFKSLVGFSEIAAGSGELFDSGGVQQALPDCRLIQPWRHTANSVDTPTPLARPLCPTMELAIADLQNKAAPAL
jgi:hypothetical protein